MEPLTTLGIASGAGSNYPDCCMAPIVLKNSSFFNGALEDMGMQLEWEPFLYTHRIERPWRRMADLNYRIAAETCELARHKSPFLVIAGEHSTAMGVWKGVMRGLASTGEVGLIWIDAHLDAHTYTTSPSGNAHGMPLAALLGTSDHRLSRIYGTGPYLDPDNLVIIGARSYEPEERLLLRKKHVKWFDREAISRRKSLAEVIEIAVRQVTKHATRFGVSIDLDVLDPVYAPAVGTPAPEGLNDAELCAALEILRGDHRFIGMEIAEYYPCFDHNQLTQCVISRLISAAFGGERMPYKSLGSSTVGISSTSDPKFSSLTKR